MIQAVFPPTQIGKDVLLAVLPFFHIAGRPVGFRSFQGEAENTDCRTRNAPSVCDYGRVASGYHATVRPRIVLPKY